MILNKNISNILTVFFSDIEKRIYGRNLAKKLKMNQKTVANLLIFLEKQNILKSSLEGKNKYYFVNKKNIEVKEIIRLIEIDKKIKFISHYKIFKELFNKLEKETNGILIIFGSYANYTNKKNSDLDIFVIGKISDVEFLEERYGIKINVVNSTKNKFNKNEYFIQEILKNHIILKGVEEFVNLIW
ncbi:MAG: nucleotidyltransferase domain-containing protein [Nanoarchaeota archaeon]